MQNGTNIYTHKKKKLNKICFNILERGFTILTFNKNCNSPEQTTRSFSSSGTPLSEVVFASKSSFYPAIH